MPNVSLLGYVRGLLRGNFAEGPDQPVHLTGGGELLIAQALPSEFELARQGQVWVVIGSAVAPVAVIPTTAAHLSLYNNDPAKSLAILAVGSFCAVTMAVAGQVSLLARNDVPGFNANPAGTLLIAGTSGKQYNGKANAKASVALGAIGTGNNVAWVPVGPSVAEPATTTVALNVHQDVLGRWLVQPAGLFSLATLAQTAVGTFQPYIVFAEVTVPLP